MNGFSYWIFGYKKFAEPIIRECICIEKGWQDISDKVSTPTIPDVLESLERRNDWGGDFYILKQKAKECLGKRKRRMALDAAFLDKNRNIIIGEFKSWGGWEKFGIKKLYDEVIQGKFFPDRLAINEVSYEGQTTNVSEFIIATNLTVQNNNDIIWKIGNLTIEVFDIVDLLCKYGEPATEKCGSFLQLEQSVNDVKKYIKTGGTEEAAKETVKVISKREA